MSAPTTTNATASGAAAANNANNNTSAGAADLSGFVPLATLQYAGAVPRPLPACTEPTPDEQVRLALAERKRELEAREVQQRAAAGGEAAAAAAGGAGGVVESLRQMAASAVLAVEKSSADMTARTETQLRQLDHQRNCDAFRQYFPELVAQGEVLLAAYGCAAMHGGARVAGALYITRRYLCFAATTTGIVGAATGQKPTGVREAIPLAEVASVQPSLALETVDGGAPFFMILPAANVVATALQVYSPSGKRVFMFLDFDSAIARAGGMLSRAVKGTPLDRAYNYIDHAWREAVTVPLEGVDYAPEA